MTTLTKPFRRVTRNSYGYGKFRRRFVVTLIPGADDMVSIRPMGLRSGEYTMTLDSVYQWMARSAAQNAQLRKARDRKFKLAERRATASRRAQERRFKASL